MKTLDNMPIEDLCINTIRTLAMDAVQKANSGHPGTPVALAPMAYVLWKKFLRFNPDDPKWLNRDRFILSNGHASMLLYAMLHLTGYDVSLEDLKNFRQWASKTPGHPEYGETPGVEMTTGPLGQGFATAVGMAMAEAHLAAVYNRDDFEIVNHHTYVFCGDGDLMEGVSHEAGSIAGHLGLGKLIVLYDDNHITIEGNTKLAYSDDVAGRFESYGWHVQNIGDKGNDLEAIASAIENARNEQGKPSMIIVRTHIAWGAPNLQDTSAAHGAPFGEEEIKLTKKFYGWPEDEKFLVPDRVLQHMAEAADRGRALEQEWEKMFDEYKKVYPGLASQLVTALNGELPQGWDSAIPEFKPSDGALATRAVSGTVLNAIADRVPYLIGGSADLSPSTKTLLKNSDYFEKGAYENRNIAWGVREFGMAAGSAGLVLHGGLRAFASTFFVFTDYARPAIRLAALMQLPIIYVMTHDSIGVGEDGPTHQPVEHLASFRTMPNVHVVRPADANETAYAWRAAMLRKEGPTILVLSRQGLPTLDRQKYASADGVLKGAYILSREKGDKPDMILMATGSEVHLVLAAQEKLAEQGIDARVVSMPCLELFREQDEAYRNEVLPPDVTARLAVEAASSFGWKEWVGDHGHVIGIDRFGASAPAKEVFKNLGFTVDNIVEKASKLL